jgi:hypothetical protein
VTSTNGSNASDPNVPDSRNRLDSVKKNTKTFKVYLKEYMKKTTFKKDLDDLWHVIDINGDGYLDKSEASKFMD